MYEAGPIFARSLDQRFSDSFNSFGKSAFLRFSKQSPVATITSSFMYYNELDYSKCYEEPLNVLSYV